MAEKCRLFVLSAESVNRAGGFGDGLSRTEQALERIAAEIEGDENVAELVRFIQAAERGIVK